MVMSDTEETRVEEERRSVEELYKMSQRTGPADNREDAAVLSAAIVSAGIATFLATWGSGVMGEGLPRVGYFIGIAIVSWVLFGWLLSNALLAFDGWLND